MCVNQILPEIHAAVGGGKLTERNAHVYFEGKKGEMSLLDPSIRRPVRKKGQILDYGQTTRVVIVLGVLFFSSTGCPRK